MRFYKGILEYKNGEPFYWFGIFGTDYNAIEHAKKHAKSNGLKLLSVVQTEEDYETEIRTVWPANK